MKVDTTKLLYGPYYAPKCKRGDKLECKVRGEEVVVGGLTDARIQWPRVLKTGKRSLIVCGDLVRAIRTESELAICHHWGVSVGVVWLWRKALGVGRVTEGTHRLYQDYKPHKLTDRVVEIGRRNAGKPEAIERMASKHRGRKAHPNTKKALLDSAKKQKSADHRRKIGESQKWRKRPELVTWTPEMDLLLGTMKDRQLAERLGKTVAAVRNRRHLLKIQAFKP